MLSPWDVAAGVLIALALVTAFLFFIMLYRRGDSRKASALFAFIVLAAMVALVEWRLSEWSDQDKLLRAQQAGDPGSSWPKEAGDGTAASQ